MPRIKKETEKILPPLPTRAKPVACEELGVVESIQNTPAFANNNLIEQTNGKAVSSYSTIESFLKLCDIQETALSMEPKPDFTAALKSEELKGKLYGLYSDKKGQAEEKEIPRLLVEFIDTPIKETSL